LEGSLETLGIRIVNAQQSQQTGKLGVTFFRRSLLLELLSGLSLRINTFVHGEAIETHRNDALDLLGRWDTASLGRRWCHFYALLCTKKLLHSEAFETTQTRFAFVSQPKRELPNPLVAGI
jgi:hypothetical protein